MHDDAAMLRRVSFCASLPDAAIARPHRHSVGTLVQLEGDLAEAMYVVAHGHIKIARIGSNGREQVLNVIGPGGHFNTVPIFDGGVCPANAEALSDVTLLALPRDALLRCGAGLAEAIEIIAACLAVGCRINKSQKTPRTDQLLLDVTEATLA